MVSTEENKRLVRRFYEDVVNTGNVDELDGLISTDYVEVYNNTKYPIGIDGAKEHVLGGRRTYPDLHLTIEQQIAEGEWVVTRVTAGYSPGCLARDEADRKTGGNDLCEHRPSGRRAIVEHGGAANLLEPLLEIGAVRIASPVDA